MVSMGWEFKLSICARVERLVFYRVILQRAMTQTLCLPSSDTDFYVGKCKGNRLFSHGFVLSSPPASDWSQNSSATAQYGMSFTQGLFFFSFPVASSCSLTIFHRDNISHWTGNLSLEIPNDMSCSGGNIHVPEVWPATLCSSLNEGTFLRAIIYWHNWLVQYMLQRSKKTPYFLFCGH